MRSTLARSRRRATSAHARSRIATCVIAASAACGGGAPRSPAPAASSTPAASTGSDASTSGALPPLWAPLFVDRKQWTMPLATYHPDRPTRHGTMTCMIDGVGPLDDHGYSSQLVCRTDAGLTNRSVSRSFEGTRAGLWGHGRTNVAESLSPEEVLLTDPPQPRQFARVIHDGREQFDIRARGQDWCITNLIDDDLTGVTERVLCLRPGVGIVGGRESTPAGDPTSLKIGSSWGIEL